MNSLQSTDRRMKALKENSILSFNAAANYPIDFIEFDVQVPYFPDMVGFPVKRRDPNKSFVSYGLPHTIFVFSSYPRCNQSKINKLIMDLITNFYKVYLF